MITSNGLCLTIMHAEGLRARGRRDEEYQNSNDVLYIGTLSLTMSVCTCEQLQTILEVLLHTT